MEKTMTNVNEVEEPPAKEYRLDELVKAFVDTRDVLEEIDERYKLERKQPLRLKELLTEQLLLKLKQTGQEMARTKYGTVTAVTRDTTSCSDPNLFIDFVRDHDAYYLLDRRANLTACKEFLEVNGQLPPGVKLNSKQDVNVLAKRVVEED
jgi:hypothetical protein